MHATKSRFIRTCFNTTRPRANYIQDVLRFHASQNETVLKPSFPPFFYHYCIPPLGGMVEFARSIFPCTSFSISAKRPETRTRYAHRRNPSPICFPIASSMFARLSGRQRMSMFARLHCHIGVFVVLFQTSQNNSRKRRTRLMCVCFFTNLEKARRTTMGRYFPFVRHRFLVSESFETCPIYDLEIFQTVGHKNISLLGKTVFYMTL